MEKDGNLLRISRGRQLQATQNATKMLKTTLKTYRFLHYINIWDQKMQTSVLYEALLSITWLEQFGSSACCPPVSVSRLWGPNNGMEAMFKL